MSYDVTLVQFHGTTGGIYRNILPGFPSSFNYLLVSLWACLPNSGANVTSINPFGGFAEVVASSNNVRVILHSHAGTTLFNGVFNGPVLGQRYNALVSVNCTTQTVQVYVNDQPSSLTSGGWVASGMMGAGTQLFAVDLGSLGGFPAVADIWEEATPTFIDLSDTANRRKFINSDLSPVDLGTNGSNPFGSSPPVWLTVPSAGVANDFTNNYGTGGSLSINFGVTLSFQAGGTCTLPSPPPVTTNLSLDNVIVQCLLAESPCTAALFPNSPSLGLRWSDTRGLTWGTPVPQDFSTDPYWQPQWNRTGYARDRVFELFWTSAYKTAINGAFVEVFPLKT